MKRILLSMMIVCLLLGCSKENTGSGNYLTGKINGVPFACNNDFWATPGRAGDKIISFKGRADSLVFSFYLDGEQLDIKTGSYPFVDGIQRNITLYEGATGYGAGYFFCSGSCSLQGSGQITLTAIDKKRVRGSFEFTTAVNPSNGLSKSVTNGSFDIERD